MVDANNPPKKKEDRDVVVFEGPVDSVYLNAGGHVELDVGTGAAVSIDSSGWKDVVVVRSRFPATTHISHSCTATA